MRKRSPTYLEYLNDNIKVRQRVMKHVGMFESYIETLKDEIASYEALKVAYEVYCERYEISERKR